MTRVGSHGWARALAALLIAVPLAARASTPPDGASTNTPVQIVDAALRDTVAALATPADAVPTRSERLRLVFTRYFDVAQMGRNSVGATWRLVAPAQQTQFLVTFETFLITSYVGPLEHAGDLKFGPARMVEPPPGPAGDGADGIARVRVDLVSTDGPPNAVLIALHRGDDGGYRIVDVAAEAVSLGHVLAADFGAFLRRNGGRLDALVGALQEKIAGAARAP